MKMHSPPFSLSDLCQYLSCLRRHLKKCTKECDKNKEVDGSWELICSEYLAGSSQHKGKRFPSAA